LQYNKRGIQKMNIKETKQLAIHAANKTAPTNYTVETVDAALAGEPELLAGSVNQFMKNRYDIYEIIIAAADEVVPKQVISALSIFADVKTVGQGQKVLFKKKLGKTRAKKFLTQVGLSGVYETFRLDNSSFEVSTYAVGGAVTIDFERLLDGAENMSELMSIITESLTDSVFLEVQKALRAAFDNSGRPDNNKVSASSFDSAEMASLVSTVKSYGNGAIIFAPPEFVNAMGPDAIVPVATGVQGVYSPDDIEAIHRTGYINIFRGTPIIQIPQSFTDETNVNTWIDPQMAYVLPTGGQKVVNVALEGNTQINDFKNRDNSMEIHIYRKIGVSIVTQYNWGIYKNTSIAQTYIED